MADQPWDFGTAHAKERSASSAQQAAEEFVKQAYRDFAEKERAFRKAYAEEITKAKANGTAVTFCKEIARGCDRVTDLEFAKNVAEGVKEAATQAVWRASADRRTVEGLREWSMRRDLAEGYGRQSDPSFESPIGGRR